MPEILIRVFNSSEWRSYRALRLRALKDSPDAFVTTYAQAESWTDDLWASRLAELSVETDLPLVAEVDGEPVGMAWGNISRTDGHTAHLYQMRVAPEHRGVGIGTLVLNNTIVWARSRGARSITLGVTCGETPARRLYTSAGFQAVGDPEPLRPGSHLLVQGMELDLGITQG